MCAHLELVTSVLVDEGGAVHRELSDLCGERSWTMDDGTGAHRCVDDLQRCLIENRVIEGGEANANPFQFWSL